ncbi:G-D-S-L family lipolytic protein [Tenacibaculum halocynthiae]|uniref:G-D-S-L family lipolytic protein n=1 Tax=Tenacibaculum halocynthiae TaxID=1254437 RepID=UPI0038939C28
MKKINFKYNWLPVLFIGLVACDVNNDLDPIKDNTPEVPVVAVTEGTADFSKYISLGASFTAGFTDGALFKEAQKNSFPNILASKFSMAKGGDFNQPLMKDNIGGMVSGANVALQPRFYFNGSGPTRLTVKPTTKVGFPADNAPAFNNYGIPGAKSFHFLAPNYGSAAGLATVPATANPYFVRMMPTQSTLLAEAASKLPTFFTLSEVGGNDVLDYAVAGGASGAITPKATFDAAFGAIINTLTAQGAKGVVANLPYITTLPHFTTVPHNPVPMTATVAAASNQGFALYNAGIKQAFAFLVANTPMTQAMADAEIAKRTINFSEGKNAVVIVDKNLTNLTAINSGLKNYRQATSEDLLVLPSSTFIGTTVGGNPLLVNGVSVPLEDKWVLTKTEVDAIKTATDGYNTTIKAMADSKGLAFVDFNVILKTASTSGLQFDEYTLNTSLIFGGLVSLDGIHLTARGYALMANKMLEAIDGKYSSNFMKATKGLAKAADYPTNYSPALLN